jgi:hypothetical protein
MRFDRSYTTSYDTHIRVTLSIFFKIVISPKKGHEGCFLRKKILSKNKIKTKRLAALSFKFIIFNNFLGNLALQ